MPNYTPEERQKKLQSFARRDKAAKVVEYLSSTAFSLVPSVSVLSAGFIPAVPLRYFTRLFTSFFYLNDLAGQHLMGRYLLGDRDRKINEFSAKLNISREQALNLLVEPGQTLTATVQEIPRQTPGNPNLTASILIEKLGCSIDDALLMLACKNGERTTKGKALGLFFGQLEVPRLTVSTLAAWALDLFAFDAFSDVATNEPNIPLAIGYARLTI